MVLTATEIMSHNTIVIASCEPRKEIKCKTSFIFVYTLEWIRYLQMAWR